MATLGTVIAQVKWQADKQRGGRIDADDLIPVGNLAYKEAWDLILASAEDYAIKTSSEFTLTGGSDSYSRVITETDFYKIKAVQAQAADGTWSRPLLSYVPGRTGVTYRLESSTLYFEPLNDCAGTYRYRYVYKPPALTAVGNTIVDVNGWVESFMVDTMVIRVRDREEEGAGLILELRKELTGRIRMMAAHRSGPKRVSDVRGSRLRRPRLPGEEP